MTVVPDQASDPWQQGSPYERYIGRWSRLIAPRFIDWLGVPPGRRWVDVGCGTGALSAAIVERAAPASLTGVDPSDGFLATARAHVDPPAQFVSGSATALPLPDRSADAVVSGLVLNFVPDTAAALAEMQRVAGAGATIAAYVWDYGGRMQLIRHFWVEALALDPAAAALDEATRFPLCRADALRLAFEASGLQAVEVEAIEVDTPFADFDDFWSPFLGGQGPAPAYVAALDPARRTRLREALRARLPVAADGSIRLVARAWAVRART
ncbi:MAG: methyltransferase domain-containing protein [Rubrivivax sp.]